MGNVRRVYVEKKPEFAVAAKDLKAQVVPLPHGVQQGSVHIKNRTVHPHNDWSSDLEIWWYHTTKVSKRKERRRRSQRVKKVFLTRCTSFWERGKGSQKL